MLPRRLFQWGKKHGLLSGDSINPFAETEKKPHEPGRPRPAPIEHVTRAYMVAEPDKKDLLLSYLITGARKSEILKWEWTDIDFANMIYAVHTRKAGSGVVKTTHHEMPDLLYDMLKRRFAKRHPTLPYVFWHRFWDQKKNDWREDRYMELNKFTKRLCKRAGVPKFDLHQLRHLGTSILKDIGDINLAKLQRFLRHDHQRTTEIYAGHIETGTQAQTDFLANYWAGILDDSEDVLDGSEAAASNKTSSGSGE